MIDLGINLFQEIAALGGGGGFSITNSLRFNDNDSAYLSRTPSVAGDRKTWTWSAWVKLGNLSIYRTLLGARLGTSNEDTFQIYLTPSDQINIGGYDYGSNGDPLLRDPSGWYHIVVAFDTTQATSTNRIKAYINGTQITLVGAFPSLNSNGAINNTQQHNLGLRPSLNDRPFDGYMAEVNFIDGQALTADDFGQINETTGEWSPKAYAGTYGTNGFYLPFDGNANDDSGNSNNWTENNLASTDYMIDTPTNNFATLNPNFRGGEVGESLAEGNLYYNSGDGDENYVCASQSVSTGKWYFEILPSSSDTHGVYGFTNADTLIQSTAVATNPFDTNNGGMIVPARDSYKINSTSTSISVTTNSVFGIALDADTGGIEFFENGVSVGSGTITGITNYIPFASMFSGSLGRIGISNFNFGADSSFAGNKTRQGNTDANGKGDFYYTPPDGYLALCTDNLPAPAIEQPETQFNVVTWTGDSTTNRAITGVGFQPDFVWIKRRDGADGHIINDSVRGIPNNLFPFSTIAENTTAYLSSLDSDGFTLDIVANGTNLSGASYVAWCWKAGGTAVSNTDGSITSQVSANVDAGFSIVSYTATNNSSNVGHGLSQAPELIIFKSRTSVSSWGVYTTIIDGSYDYLRLNGTDAKSNSVLTAPSSSVMYVNNTEFSGTNVGSNNYIAYAFHSVEGFSKFGSYVGNGSTDGPFVYTGFKPAFVIIKASDNTKNWVMYDNERTPVNQIDTMLFSNSSGADYTDSTIGIDFLSNGFKLRSTNNNTNGNTNSYIYMAFAEHPFKEALAR